MPGEDSAEKALERALAAERVQDSKFDEKRRYWDELYAQGLPAQEIAKRMEAKFGST